MTVNPGSDFKERGGWWVVLQSLLMLGVLVTGPLCHHGDAPVVLIVFATALLVVGALFGILGVTALGRNRTIFPKPLEEGRLVQTGVYGRVRHPLYSSLIHLSFGWAFLWHCGAVAVLALLLTMLLYCKTLREEAWLREKYSDYAGYAARVKRFVPRIL